MRFDFLPLDGYYLYCDCHYNFTTKELAVAKTATIQARIDPEVKAKAQRILAALNISMSEAIALYLTQVNLHNGIPFEIKIPNELTAETLRRSEKGEDLHEVADGKNLIDELEN
jgi:DNA-damage-inducible protein J